MAVTQSAGEFTMVDKLAEIKGLVGDLDATENPMAFYDYIVEAMKGRPVDDSFRRDLEGFRHNIEWSLYLNRFVVATFEGSPDADLNLTSMRFTCAKDKDGNWVGLYLGPLAISTNLDRAKELGIRASFFKKKYRVDKKDS